uniref:RNA polymerase II subunit B1 CTD phosphatase RPAP2 homolog n=1 Tax=Timema cristinae TaxID=61476 RepID=A0A7R9H543_TIMCR|nr:unnamed protein product [Timema cristinae]
MYINSYFQLKFINKSHFEDVVEERAIISLCGYPLCGHRLKSTVAKQYHISTKLNKVYNITERKGLSNLGEWKSGQVQTRDRLGAGHGHSAGRERVDEEELCPCRHLC